MEASLSDVAALTDFLEREFPSLDFPSVHALNFEKTNDLGQDYINMRAEVGKWNEKPVYGYMKCGTSRSLRQGGSYVIHLSDGETPTKPLDDFQTHNIELVPQLQGVFLSSDGDEESVHFLKAMIRAAFILQGHTNGRPAVVYDDFDGVGRAIRRIMQTHKDQDQVIGVAGRGNDSGGKLVHRTNSSEHSPPTSSASMGKGPDRIAIERLFNDKMGSSADVFLRGLRWASSEQNGATEKLYVGTRKEKPVWAYFQRTTSDNCVLKVLQEGTTADIGRIELNTVEICPVFSMVPPTLGHSYRGNLVRYLWKACFVLRGHSAGYPVTVGNSFIHHLSRVFSMAGGDQSPEIPTQRRSGSTSTAGISESPVIATRIKLDRSTPLPQATKPHAAQSSEITDESSRHIAPDHESGALSSLTDDDSLIFMGEATVDISTKPQRPIQGSNGLQTPKTSAWTTINMPATALETTQSSNKNLRPESFSPAITAMLTQPLESAHSLSGLKRPHVFSRDTEEELTVNERGHNSDTIEEEDHTHTSVDITAILSEYLQIQRDRSKATSAQKHLSVLRRGYEQELEDLAKQQTDQSIQLIRQCDRIDQERREAIQTDVKDVTCRELIRQAYNKRKVEADTRHAIVMDSATAKGEEIDSRILALRSLDIQAEKEMKSGRDNISNLNRQLRKLMDEGGFHLGYALYGHEVIDQANKRRRIE